MTLKITRKRSNKNKKPRKNKSSLLIILIIVVVLIASTVAAFTIMQEDKDVKSTKNEKNTDESKNFNDTDPDASSYEFKGTDFSFYDLSGNIKYLSDYTGKVVVLDLWATSCSPCQYQMIELKKLYDNYTSDQVKILSVNIESSDTASVIKDFMNQFEQIGYKLEWFFGNQKDSLLDYMPGGAIPAITIFDKEGQIVLKKSGLAFYNQVPQGYPSDTLILKNEIDKLL